MHISIRQDIWSMTKQLTNWFDSQKNEDPNLEWDSWNAFPGFPYITCAATESKWEG